MYLLAFATLLTAHAGPGWVASTSATATPSAVATEGPRADDVACRRASIVRQPGKSLDMDWAAHRRCMAERGWTPSAAARRTARAEAAEEHPVEQAAPVQVVASAWRGQRAARCSPR